MTEGKGAEAHVEARPQHLGVLLERARRRLYARVAEQVLAAGFSELRPGHTAVFAFLPPVGARLTTLARRAQMTKQSMGELVRELERLGYVRLAPDPSDRRAKIVTLTERGRAANDVGIRAAARVEAEWARELGGQRARELRTVLQELTDRPEAVPPRHPPGPGHARAAARARVRCG